MDLSSRKNKLIFKITYNLKNWLYKIKKNWESLLSISLSLILGWLVFGFLSLKRYESFDTTATLSNILTTNGVFSAILITYLFSRTSWIQERKLDHYREAIELSQKITDFRRILDKLTDYYNVWHSDIQTKNLIDHGKFNQIEFYDYRLYNISDYMPENAALIDEMGKHEHFSEGISTLYLAMVSLVRNRKSKIHRTPELYKDFKHNGIYNIKVVEKWIECDIFNTIWYWCNQDQSWINYRNLSNDRDYILSAAARINKKYEGVDLNNNLIKELADDFSSHYINELYTCLKSLKKGLNNLNLIFVILIFFSLLFGVLAPSVILLLVNSGEDWLKPAVAIIAMINIQLISYFILRFPFLINSELKWT